MKKISCWAKHHQSTARFIIILSFVLLNVTAIVTGTLLDNLNIMIPASVLFLSVLFLIALSVQNLSRLLKLTEHLPYP